MHTKFKISLQVVLPSYTYLRDIRSKFCIFNSLAAFILYTETKWIFNKFSNFELGLFKIFDVLNIV